MTRPELLVRVGQQVIGREEDVLVTLGLGSCIAITLYEPRARIGGMVHILLPEPTRTRDLSNPFRYASTAVPGLVEAIRAEGGSPRRMEARLVGGAAMFAALATPHTLNTGQRNIAAAREALRVARVPIRGEAVGGDYGRSARFFVADGTVRVTSAFRDAIIL